MDDVRNVIAEHVRAILFVIGVGLVILGGVGPGPIGIVSVIGIITLLAAVVLASPIAQFLQSKGDSERDEPAIALREQYISGELDEAEFERRMERLLDNTEYEHPGTDIDVEDVSVSPSINNPETE